MTQHGKKKKIIILYCLVEEDNIICLAEHNTPMMMMMIAPNSRARKGGKEGEGEGGVWKNFRGEGGEFLIGEYL